MEVTLSAPQVVRLRARFAPRGEERKGKEASGDRKQAAGVISTTGQDHEDTSILSLNLSF